MCKEAHFRTVIRTYLTKRRTCRNWTFTRPSTLRRWLFAIVTWASMEFAGMSMDIRLRIRMSLLFGRLSLGTFLMERRSSLITIWWLGRANGVYRQAWCSICPMAWTGRGLSTARLEFKGSFNYQTTIATRISAWGMNNNCKEETFRLWRARQPQTISMYWEDNYEETTESP